MTSEFQMNHSEDQMSDMKTRLAIIRTIEAEKRTHLAELRTGIGIMTIPLSLLTILIATSQYYEINEVLPFIIGLSLGIVVLIVVGGNLVFRAMRNMRSESLLLEQAGIHTEDVINDYCHNNGH